MNINWRSLSDFDRSINSLIFTLPLTTRGGYVCLVGLVVSGEWNLPDSCRGGVRVCMVDKRMERADEATLGSYYTAAAKKRFQFKVVPNYGITTMNTEFV